MALSAHDIIKDALVILDVSQPWDEPDVDEMNLGLRTLNLMLDQWCNEKVMINAMKNELFDIVIGQASYTIGNTGSPNWSTTRPTKIEKAFVRIANNNNQDFQIELIDNNQYQEIMLKAMSTTYPLYLYYSPTFPNGTVYLWPVPATTAKIMIAQPEQLTNFTTFTQAVSLPKGYESALIYNLAVELASRFGKQIPQIVMERAQSTKSNIAHSNMQPLNLKTDSALLSKSRFNIYAGW